MKKLLALLVCALILAMPAMAVTFTKEQITCGGFPVWKYTFSDGTVSYSGKFARFVPWLLLTGKC